MVTTSPLDTPLPPAPPQFRPNVLAPAALRTLARLARDWLRRGIRRSDAIGTELRRIDPLVDQARATGTPAVPTHHPVVRHLAPALDGFRGLEPLAQVGMLLPWRHADSGDASGAASRDQLARAELIGPEAPLLHPDFSLGFLLMAPHADHPAPVRPATELHHIVSGRAFWTVGETTVERRSGDFILHPSDRRKAIRTADEPLLTIYTLTRNRATPLLLVPGASA